MNPIKSFKERYKQYSLKHFENSKYCKKLKIFKNIHRGETCFIIGNGPSLTAEDLERIADKNIPTFAFNKIYLMFNKTKWKPTYYISQDFFTLNTCVDEVNKMNLKYKFIPLYLKYYNNINIDNAYYFNLRLLDDFDYNIFLSENFSKYVGDSATVAVTAGQLAVYMGFKKIFFLGMDHNFSVYKNRDGEIIKDSTVKNYFTQSYNKENNDICIPNIDKSTESYIALKKFCDKQGIEIYNATRGGKLEVFPRVDFDEEIKKL